MSGLKVYLRSGVGKTYQIALGVAGVMMMLNAFQQIETEANQPIRMVMINVHMSENLK